MSNKKTTKTKPEPRRYDTPAADAITAPSLKRHAVLPLVDVGSRQFEEICRDLMRQNFPDLRPAMKRRSGQPQFGVDVEGFNDLQEPAVVISAKCYKEIQAWEFRAWIEDFTKHLGGHWKGKGVKEFVIAVAIERNDDDMNDAARELARDLAKQGIKFKIWDSVEISEMLGKDPRLVDRYFNEAWVTALSTDFDVGTSTAASGALFSARGPTASQGAILAQIESLYVGPLNEMLSTTLEHAVAELRRGRRSEMKRWLEDARSDFIKWQGADPELKAKGLRATAMVVLGEGDLEKSERLLDEADAFAPAPDRTTRAFLIRARDGGAAARRYLQGPDGRRERELMAALLIESHEPKQALEELAPLIGDEASAEVLRLRAMATLLIGGRRSEAINLVVSATTKEPDSAMALFARGAVRLACALVEGVALQFGGVPNPIGKSLVRSTAEARTFLSQAAADFDRLLETVEGEFRRDVEVWKLAALLLNPDTKAQGRTFARSLFAREDYDPSAVAWALLNGLPLKQGRIRKTLGDALREGKGTPSHVAVLALLAAGASQPERGMAVIERFAPLFPEASEFFDHWRGQFACSDKHEKLTSFSAVMRHAIASKDIGPLYAFIATDHVEIENVLVGAEVLASLGAFDRLDALRDKLARLHSVRAVELAAVAALNNGDPRASISILNGARDAGVDMSRRLSYVRLKAWEALGSHQELIDDIQSLLVESEDPLLRDELLNAYLRIGALDGIREQAEFVLQHGGIDQRKAVQVALALRSYAPEIARRALEGLDREELPDDLSGLVLELSSRLGLAALQDEMIRRMVSNPASKESFRSFDSLEDVLAVLEEHAKEYRSLLEQWMHGRLPAAGAMRSNPKDYVSLFLADPATRHNRLGDVLPMMLRSGMPRDLAPLPDEERPAVRLDLSALLLAARCELLDDLEHCFEIHLPESLPEALVLVTAEYHQVVPSIADAVRTIARGGSAVDVCAAAPDGTMEIVAFQAGDDEQKALAAYVFQQAYSAGHILRSRLDELFSVLEISPSLKPKPIERLLLGRGAVVELARLEVLEPIARGFPLAVTQTDVDGLSKQLLVAEDEQRMRETLLDLTKRVSERLAASAWKTVLPKRSNKDNERARNLPPHLRCLVETLPGEEDVGKVLFWIEDRTLSQQRLGGSLTLADVLSLLARMGRLSGSRVSDVQERLRQWGYLFLPIDIEDLATTIQASPVVDGELVENAKLTEVRRWFARDVRHLVYLEQKSDVDEQGRIIGEIRRTLDLSALSRDLLTRIWRSQDGTDSERKAQANWIWQNLRMTHLPPPVGRDAAEGVRSIAALAGVQVLTLPIHAELNNARLPAAARKAYMEWTLSSAVDPLVDADGELLETISEMTAAMLRRILERHAGSESDPDADEVSKAFDLIVRRFLGLLPDEWEERITRRCGLKDMLKIQRVMLISIDEKLQVSVRTLEEAIDRCVSEGKTGSEIKLHDSKTRARLEVGTDDAGLPNALIKIGKRSLPLHRSTLALVHPVQSVRETLLSELEGKGSVGRPFTAEYLSTIARETDVEKRVDSLHERFRSDFARRKELMSESLSRSGTIQLSDLDLPSVGEILSYLGLPAEFRGSTSDLVIASSEALRGSMGVERAMYRLSSLPVDLLKRDIEDFAEAVARTTDVWPREESVMAAHLWLVTHSAIGRPVSEDESWLTGSITKERAKLLATFVRHSARQALRSEEWRSLPPDFALCLVWVHADQLSRNFASSNVDLPHFIGWLSSRSRSKLFDFERERIWSDWVVDVSLQLSANLLIAKIVGHLLRSGAPVPDHLKSLLGQKAGEQWTPYPEALVPTPNRAPEDFWIAMDPMAPMIQKGWLGEDHPFNERDREKLLSRIFEETKEGDPGFFVSLISLLIDVDKVELANLGAIREKLDAALSHPGAKAEESFAMMADLLAQVCGRTADSEGFEKWIRETSKESVRQWPHGRVTLTDEKESGRVLTALLNAVYVFAKCGDRDLCERIRIITSCFRTVVEIWPASLVAVIGCLEGMSRELGVDVSRLDILPTLLELRER
ncbi:hypothetical protein [Rhizobium leguminosarum]|uniref:hypothetical protein n=1 Tax=Rhizobium leguminosarum TaxID=384 RepID=UPI00037A3027|nr:hypothetical protein [Rhizobium leguminosarum]